MHLSLLKQSQFSTLLLQLSLSLQFLPLLLLIGCVEIELVMGSFHFVQSLVFGHLQLSSVLVCPQQLLIILVFTVLLSLLIDVFFLHLFVEILLLKPLVLPGAFVVA